MAAELLRQGAQAAPQVYVIEGARANGSIPLRAELAGFVIRRSQDVT
ncbi:MAG TPA: hypothetical protein VFL79_19275 [Terriglobia bacterium]|nr:hypothetical protein [Terriglobia bacterium]